jgi:hypothetical protein
MEMRTICKHVSTGEPVLINDKANVAPNQKKRPLLLSNRRSHIKPLGGLGTNRNTVMDFDEAPN